MEMKFGQDNGKYLYRVLCVLAAAAALLPVGCNYIMDGGIVTEWLARVEELAAGCLGLFPSSELFARTGIWENAMNSNLWFLFPGLLYRLSGSMVLAYRVYMLLVQAGTFLFSLLFFQRFFAGEESRLPACFGVFLYMTCPYRIFVCYDWANLSLAAAWMLLPLYAWAVVGLLRKKGAWRDAAVAALALAGIGYADAISFLAVLGATLLAALCFRKLLPLAAAAAGGILFLPGLYRLAGYLFLGGFQEPGLPIQTIMQSGYRPGQFLGLYMYRDGHPGMGLGMLAGILAGLWMCFVNGKGNVLEREEQKESHGRRTHGGNARGEKFFVGLSLLLMCLSLRYFPWDLVQRLGGWAMKLVSLAGTPAVFGGLALGSLCVPAAGSVNRVSRHENKVTACAIPIIVLLACLGVCIYQCNMLTYTRPVLELSP